MVRLRPIIGITAGYDYEKNRLFLKRGYYEGVCEAGGIPSVIPPVQEDGILDEILDKCDGILLSGGPDIDAGLFGENNLQCNGEISPYRDKAELYIAKRAIEKDKPLLGICRGIQIMNVSMGGTLYQDIYYQNKGAELIRHSQNAPEWYPTHAIIIAENTIAAGIFAGCNARVNSFHHQAVKDLAPGFIISSRAGDGVIESMEHTTARFAMGVQWHPELMWEKDRKHLNLFKELVGACK